MTDSEINQVVAQNIKKARLEANISQECLSELVGVHPQTISNLELGRFAIDSNVIARLCHALEISPNSIFEGLPEPDRIAIDQIKKAYALKRRPKIPDMPKVHSPKDQTK